MAIYPVEISTCSFTMTSINSSGLNATWHRSNGDGTVLQGLNLGKAENLPKTAHKTDGGQTTPEAGKPARHMAGKP